MWPPDSTFWEDLPPSVGSAENVNSETFSLSDPFEYEAHLNKMQSDRIAPPTPSSTPATSTVATDNHDDSKGGEHTNE